MYMVFFSSRAQGNTGHFAPTAVFLATCAKLSKPYCRVFVHSRPGRFCCNGERGEELLSFMWVVVKIMLRFWVLIILRHLIFRVPIILTTTHVLEVRAFCVRMASESSKFWAFHSGTAVVPTSLISWERSVAKIYIPSHLLHRFPLARSQSPSLCAAFLLQETDSGFLRHLNNSALRSPVTIFSSMSLGTCRQSAPGLVSCSKASESFRCG